MMRIALLVCLAVASCLAAQIQELGAAECGFAVDRITQVTKAAGKSQTARDNARCIYVDPGGTAHMVWTDDRHGPSNIEIYYAAVADGSVSREVRLTNSLAESSFPCIAGRGEDIYVLWQEKIGSIFQICYVHLRDGRELARREVTSSILDAGCPVAAVALDGSLHIAWHEGPMNMTAIYYGRMVSDSLVVRTEICTKHPTAFRSDIAVNASGHVLLAWYEGLDIKSRLWDGRAWGDETLVATNDNREWRLSLAAAAGGKWALAWYNQAATGTDVLAALYDGKTWYGRTRVNTSQNGFYPAIACFDGDKLVVTWEDKDKADGKYLLLMSCYDGRSWSEPADIMRDTTMSRYSSLAPVKDAVHVVWFGPKTGNDEIFHGLLRRK